MTCQNTYNIRFNGCTLYYIKCHECKGEVGSVEVDDAKEGDGGGGVLFAPQIEDHEHEGGSVEDGVEEKGEKDVQEHDGRHAYKQHVGGIGDVAQELGAFVRSSVFDTVVSVRVRVLV